MAITREIATALIEGALRDGGITLNLSDNNHRWVVGGLVPSFYVDAEFARGSHDNMARQLQLPSGVKADTLGSWLDKGTIYVDYGTRHFSAIDAFNVARERGELAVWDSLTEQEFRL